MSELQLTRDGGRTQEISNMDHHEIRARSRSITRAAHRSLSRSVSPRKYSKRYRSRTRSRSRSPRRSRGYEGSRSYGRPSYGKSDESPGPNKCLGVFGLSLRTTERNLRDVFTRYGAIEECTVVIDAQTGRSRGFAFIYFDVLDDAKAAKESCNGIDIDGRKIRVDFSITQRAHTPTPGIYMGNKFGGRRPPRYGNTGRDYNNRRYSSHSYRRSSPERDRGDGYRHDYESRKFERGGHHYDRSPSPRYRGRHTSRSHSFSPRNG